MAQAILSNTSHDVTNTSSNLLIGISSHADCIRHSSSFDSCNTSTSSSMSPSSDSPLLSLSSLPPLLPNQSSYISWHDESLNLRGCSHYQKNCLIHCVDCPPDTYFACRFCHDEEVDEHRIDRHSIDTMICMICASKGKARIQPVGGVCRDCNGSMSRYYCDICHFFDDHPNRDIFHCSPCGICRRGPSSEFFHCATCNCCYSIQLQPNHKCIENVLNSNCVICQEYLFTSTVPVHFLRCGHAIHAPCLRALTDQHQQDLIQALRCPTCKQSVHSEDLYRDAMLLQWLVKNPMPLEYKRYKATILCNDCHKQNKVRWHFALHRCPDCLAFNCDVIQKEKDEGEFDEEKDESERNNEDRLLRIAAHQASIRAGMATADTYPQAINNTESTVDTAQAPDSASTLGGDDSAMTRAVSSPAATSSPQASAAFQIAAQDNQRPIEEAEQENDDQFEDDDDDGIDDSMEEAESEEEPMIFL